MADLNSLTHCPTCGDELPSHPRLKEQHVNKHSSSAPVVTEQTYEDSENPARFAVTPQEMAEQTVPLLDNITQKNSITDADMVSLGYSPNPKATELEQVMGDRADGLRLTYKTANEIQQDIDNEPPAWSPYGEYVLETALRFVGEPMMFIGESGTGKTYLAKYLAKSMGIGFRSMNCNEQMGMDALVGIPAPVNSEQGVYLKWVDGMLTEAIRNGYIFLMEEATRAPDELRSACYSVTDQVGRSWSIPQASGITDADVPVHEDFWFIMTANPPGGAYTTFQLDPAMVSRLAVQFRINQPLADERVVLSRLVKTDTALISPEYGEQARSMSRDDLVNRLMKFVHDSRPPIESSVDFLLPYEEPRARCFNTRDLITVLKTLLKGFSPVETASLVINGYGAETDKGIKKSLIDHFGGGSW